MFAAAPFAVMIGVARARKERSTRLQLAAAAAKRSQEIKMNERRDVIIALGPPNVRKSQVGRQVASGRSLAAQEVIRTQQ